jgi:hypothetical protein
LASAGGAAAFAAVLVLLAYVIVDLYLSGHNLSRRDPGGGDPWYQTVAGILLVVVPIIVGVLVFRRGRAP